MVDPFRFGRPLARAADCCTKPVGCTMTQPGCLFLNHPWKRAVVFGDTTVRCQAKSYGPDTDPATGWPVEHQCPLMNRHEGGHPPAPLGPAAQRP